MALKSNAEQILDSLNDKQREVVRTVSGPLLVVAGPGSGKTRVLVARIAWLLAEGHARPHEILAMTFTNKAARGMLERTKALLQTAGCSTQIQAGRNRLWMGTFHSMFARIIRIHAERIGFTSDFSIYDNQDSEQVIKRLLAQEDIADVKPRPVHGFISWAKNRMLFQDQIEPKSDVQRVAAKLMGDYEKVLRDANAMDFDDLLLNAYKLFRQHKDVLEHCQNRWKHVLIDEFQDTNLLQYRLAQMIARKHGNICAVGDDCQSIYAFRGAEIRNMLLFNQDFPKVKIIRLEQNYRSTRNILKLADSVIRHNVGRIDKTLWTSNKEGSRIQIISAHSGEQEAEKVIGQIQHLIFTHRFRYRDFAVLYRTNRLSRQYEDALRKSGIPYRVYGGLSFYQRKEVKNACSYLRLLVNPNDVASFLRVVNYPKRGVGIVSQQAILAFARRSGKGLPDALDRLNEIGLRSAKSRRELVKFRNLLDNHAERLLTEDDLMPVIESLLRESGLWDEIRSDDTIAVESRLENLQELLGAIQHHVTTEEGTLSSFLQQVELATSEDSSDASADSVTLMTAHSSKGLEYEVVFICGMEEGLFPVTLGEPTAVHKRPRPLRGADAESRSLPWELEFEDPQVRRTLETIALLNNPDKAARTRNTAVQEALARLSSDGMRSAVSTLLETSGASHSLELQKLKEMLADLAANCSSIDDILQQVDAIRLQQDVDRATAHQGAATSDACEEERRLFYVAVTRAKSRLFLLWARRRFYAGGVRWGDPSRFLSELDSALVEQPFSKPTAYRPRHQFRRPGLQDGRSRPRSLSRTRANKNHKPAYGESSRGNRAAAETIGPGDRVYHSTHGSGKVIRTVQSAYGKQATVLFDKSGERKLILRYARLEKLS